MDRMPQPPAEVAFHLDRLDAWLRELWSICTIDVYACDGTVRRDQAGLLQDIRDDVRVIREELRRALEALPA